MVCGHCTNKPRVREHMPRSRSRRTAAPLMFCGTDRKCLRTCLICRRSSAVLPLERFGLDVKIATTSLRHRRWVPRSSGSSNSICVMLARPCPRLNNVCFICDSTPSAPQIACFSRNGGAHYSPRLVTISSQPLIVSRLAQDGQESPEG